MFLWVRCPAPRTINSFLRLWCQLELHLDDHPSFSSLGYKALEMKLWTEIADAGVLFAPGDYFVIFGLPSQC